MEAFVGVVVGINAPILHSTGLESEVSFVGVALFFEIGCNKA